jgi:hypothetical protein
MPRKHKTLSSNPSTAKIKRKERKRKGKVYEKKEKGIWVFGEEDIMCLGLWKRFYVPPGAFNTLRTHPLRSLF